MVQSILLESPPILIWYGVCLVFGFGMFPVVFTVFRHFPDRGFSLTKVFALWLLSYSVWLTTSLGLTAYQRQTILGATMLLLAVNGVLLIRQWRDFWRFVRHNLGLLFSVEAVFLAFFLIALIIRMYSPDITGAEKEADFTFLNALLHSDSFPPKDPWFAGATINYYYGGYLLWATVIHLTGVIAPVGFNLAVVTIVALSASGAFGLVVAFTRKRRYGLLAALLLVGLGNLDGLMQLIERGGNPLPFNWWQSSRVIPDTINEFPFFSFLLGDLHAHFMSIPGLLLLFGILAQLVCAADISASPAALRTRLARWFPFRSTPHFWSLFLLSGLLLGATSLINSWDYPTSVIITAICPGVAFISKQRAIGSRHAALRGLSGALAMLLALVAISRVAYWPFYQHFSAPLGLGNLRFVAAEQRTQLGDFVIVYGIFLWIVGLCVLAPFTPVSNPEGRWRPPYRAAIWNGFALACVSAYLLFGTWVVPLSVIVAGAIGFLIYRDDLLPASVRQTDVSALQSSGLLPSALVFMAFAITAGCELMYIKDFYGHPLERQNTIFKFYYQAWIFLAIGTPYLLARFSEYTRLRRRVSLRVVGYGVLILLCAASAIYPIFATYERAGQFRGGDRGGLFYLPTLNGISYIAFRYPQEYEALMWIQRNLPHDAVILEATGDPYSFFGRVSSVTGRSTVLGWGNHEALWRDATWQSITQRTNDIARIYEAPEKAEVLDLLQAYRVDYVYVGKLEKESYGADTDTGLRAFETDFPIVYRNAFVTLYQVTSFKTP